MGLEVSSRRQWFVWTIGFLFGVLNCWIVPVFIFLEKVMTRSERELNTTQCLIMVMYFGVGLHSMPIFINLLKTERDLVNGFNSLVAMEKYVRGNNY
jgi:uncharacterized oligopeptide transporter (OPT) family protein